MGIKVKIIQTVLSKLELKTVLKKLNSQFHFIVVKILSDETVPEWKAYFPGYGSFEKYSTFLKTNFNAIEAKSEFKNISPHASQFECKLNHLMLHLSKQDYEVDTKSVAKLLDNHGSSDVVRVIKETLDEKSARPLSGRLDISGLTNPENLLQIVNDVLAGKPPSTGLEKFKFRTPAEKNF